MNKTILALSICSITSGFLFTSCTSNTAEKVETAKENVKDANEELNKANDAYLLDIENFKKESSEKIAANEKSIAEFNARIDLQKKEAKADYKKKIEELEQKNTDMRKKMDDYQAEGKDNWEKFKTEFNHDMDELGNAFKDLTVKNTK